MLATTGGLLLSLSSRIRALERWGLGSVLLYVPIGTLAMKINILAVFGQPALFRPLVSLRASTPMVARLYEIFTTFMPF